MFWQSLLVMQGLVCLWVHVNIFTYFSIEKRVPSCLENSMFQHVFNKIHFHSITKFSLITKWFVIGFNRIIQINLIYYLDLTAPQVNSLFLNIKYYWQSNILLSLC